MRTGLYAYGSGPAVDARWRSPASIPPAALAMQSHFGADRYTIQPPLLGSGVTVARLRTQGGDASVDSAFNTDSDILSLHLAPLRARFWLDGRLKPASLVPAGTACLISRGSSGRAEMPGGAQAIHIHIPEPSLARAAEDQLEWSKPTPPELHIGDRVRDPLLEQLVRGIAGAAEAGGEVDRLYADTLTGALTAHLLRRYSGALGPASTTAARGGLAPRQLQRVTDYMEAGIEGEVPLSALAEIAGLSVHHFCRAFKQSTGLPPHAWMTMRRMERVKTLLADAGLTMTEIALATGYSSQSAMGAAFRRATGVTPSAWRRQL